MSDHMRTLLMEGGLIKTPSIAASGWFSHKIVEAHTYINWDTFQVFAGRFILVATAITVGIHAANAIVKQCLCKARFDKGTGVCKKCIFWKHCRFMCPRGIKEDDEPGV